MYKSEIIGLEGLFVQIACISTISWVLKVWKKLKLVPDDKHLKMIFDLWKNHLYPMQVKSIPFWVDTDGDLIKLIFMNWKEYLFILPTKLKSMMNSQMRYDLGAANLEQIGDLIDPMIGGLSIIILW